MIHYITLPMLILYDYQKRGVFPRYHSSYQHCMMSDISAKVSTDELRALLNDAEAAKPLAVTQSPNLTRAYVRLAEKAREILRREPVQVEIGRDGKSAAAGAD